MATLSHQVWINAPVSKVYAALATADGLGRWWAPHTSTETEAGLVLAHGAGTEHGEVRMMVLESTQDRRVEWEIVSTHPSRSPACAWTGTHISFEMTERQNPGHWLGHSDDVPRMAVIEFRHSGWDEHSEYFGFCNFAWGETLLMLKQWCESPAGYIPPGFNTVTPYFFVQNAESFVQFLIRGLSGVETLRSMRPDGLIANVQVQLGTSTVMVSEASDRYKPMASTYYLYVADARAAMAKALANGAALEMEVADMPYGDRQGGVKDVHGNIWWISQRIVHEPYAP